MAEGSELRVRGQASLEMAAAMTGILLLLFGSFKVCLWAVERIVTRQQAYHATRVEAASASQGIEQVDPVTLKRSFTGADGSKQWDDTASRIRLKIFEDE